MNLSIVKRGFALLLAILLLATVLPTNIAPVYSAESGEEQTPSIPASYRDVMGYTATFTGFYPVPVTDTPETVVNPFGTDCEQLREEEVSAQLELVIVDYYYDQQKDLLWYKVEAAPGCVLPELLEQNPWVFQDFVKEPWGASLTIHSSEKNYILDDQDQRITEIGLPAYGSVEIRSEATIHGATAYQWQICYDVENDLWVNIYGADTQNLTLTYGQVSSLLEDGVAYIRSKAQSGTNVQYSESIPVTVTEQLFAAQSDTTSAPQYAAGAEEMTRAAGKNTISVIYQASTPGMYNVPAPQYYEYPTGTQLDGITIQPVQIPGYATWYNEAQVDEIHLSGTLEADLVCIVVYKPAQTTYKVNHLHQNVYDDNYTVVKTETINGITESMTTAAPTAYTGFYSLNFVQTEIAGDGSTVINIYYNRYYYLMTFDLQGGHGTEPLYARYGTDVSISTPIRAGYEFDRWCLSSDPQENKVTLPAQLSENGQYKAVWRVATDPVEYTIAYWIQNPDNPAKYDFSYSISAAGTTETPINWRLYQTIATNDAVSATLRRYIELNEEKCEQANLDLEVAGDGTSVVNIYYDRKSYSLRFYYAMSSGSQAANNMKYYVIGGSTYYFGSWGANTDDEIALLDNYMSGKSSERGGVDELPTFQSPEKEAKYQKGSVKSTVNNTEYTYYYLTFDAKYGADIRDLWPADIFNSVTRTDKNNTNGWSGKEAFMSAWNGEHHVKYSQTESNQTIKGKYTVLDERLLWASNFGEPADGVVSYLCFWENGANISWSVPKLFRYHIYVEDFPGINKELPSKVYNGKIYYLVDKYDVCDDSGVSGQTSPGLVGHNYVGRNNSGSITLTADEKKVYKEGYEVYFYYTVQQLTLEFHNPTKEDAAYLGYKSDLKDLYYEPELPVGEEPGSMVFEGWYTSKECTPETKVNFNTMTMPSTNLVLYANWTPVLYDVKVYQSADKTNLLKDFADVAHGTVLGDQAVTVPDNGHWIFDGWWYVDAKTGKETIFNFSSSRVTQDMEIYAKWYSDDVISYEILFVYNDGTREIEIADRISSSALAGKTLTFNAKGAEELYEGYQTSYFPRVPNHSIDLKLHADGTVPEMITWKFEYDYIPVNVPYTVRYLLKDEFGNVIETPASFPQEKKVTINKKAVVTENAEAIPGYAVEQEQITMVLDAANPENNVIIFYYTEEATASYFKVRHYLTDYGASGAYLYKEFVCNATVGDVVEAAGCLLDIPGYDFDAGRSDDQLTVTTETEILNLYYTEQTAQIRFVPVDVSGAVNSTANGTVSPSGKQTIGAVTGQPEATVLAKDGYMFLGWYKDENCTVLLSTEATFTPPKNAEKHYTDATYYAKFVYSSTSLTLRTEGCQSIDEDQCYLFRLTGNGLDLVLVLHGNTSVTVDGLLLGQTYTVTEVSDWSWRYEVSAWDYGTASGTGDAATIVITPGGTITFTNEREETQWLDGNASYESHPVSAN